MVKAPPRIWRKAILEGRGTGLLTARDVKAGELILAEEPLVSFHAVPKDVIHQMEWLTVGKRPDGEEFANGKQTIAAGLRKVSPNRKKKFRELHGEGRNYTDADRHHQDYDLSRVRLNAFSDDDPDEHGLQLSVERVFEIISRINHSCKPNAVMTWNKRLEQGTIFAITGISEGDEITISYYADLHSQLRSIRERCTMLFESHGFVCLCPACGPSTRLHQKPQALTPSAGGQSGRPPRRTPWTGDMEIRERLRVTHEQTTLTDIPKSMREKDDDEAREARRREQVQHLEDYLRDLKSLGIRDANLANPHEAMARYCELGTHAANLRMELGDQAPAYLPQESPESFAREALDHWRGCENAHMLCSGDQHQNFIDARDEAQRAQKLLNGFRP